MRPCHLSSTVSVADRPSSLSLESRNVALQGTLCTEGTAVGIVVGCGDSTVFGRIAKAAGRSRPLPSTLEEEIRHFVIIIASLAAAVVVLIISASRTSPPPRVSRQTVSAH